MMVSGRETARLSRLQAALTQGGSLQILGTANHGVLVRARNGHDRRDGETGQPMGLCI
jgi:hypothetical protein